MNPNIEETLVDWLGERSLEIKRIDVGLMEDIYERKYLEGATGEFYPVAFDRLTDGVRIAKEYQELTYDDERFTMTKLIFISDTEFKIV